MKQITYEEVKKLATKNKRAVQFTIECCMAEWIQVKSREIAEIIIHKRDKTNFGEWEKGWISEMKRTARENAYNEIIRKFIANYCIEQDGAIWLNDWQMICEIENNNTTK